MHTRSLATTIVACALALTACTQPGQPGTLTLESRPRPSMFSRPRASPGQSHARADEADESPMPDDRCDAEGWSAALETLLTASRESVRGPIAPPRPWDRATVPRYMDRVDRRFAITPGERDALARDGFAVPDRMQAGTYAYGYHLVHQAELPVYLSADSMLHVVASLHEPLLAHLEEQTLAPMLSRALARMHDALTATSRTLPDEAAGDVDLLLTVARSLLELDEGTVPAALGSQPAITELTAVARANARRSERYLFGRPRVMDFSEYLPRGHYASSPVLSRYFRATMWLSHVELNLESRGCRSSHPGPTADTRETPREVMAALAFAELVDRAGASEDLARIDLALSVLLGRREDVSLAQVNVMRDVVHIHDLRADDTLVRFHLVARNQARRSARTQSLPDEVIDVPVVATVLGARLRPGANLPADLVAPRVQGRALATAAEAAYALGVERARVWLDAPIAASPGLEEALDRARSAVPATVGGNDLVSNWFRAVTALGGQRRGRGPSFMGTDAFADLRLNAVVAGYGQFLMRDEVRSESAFTSMGCRIPTGWVDPLPDVYAAIGSYAERALALAQAMFEWNGSRAESVRARDRAFLHALDSLSRVSRALRLIADDELEGRVLSELQMGFLSMVAEVSLGDSAGPPAYDGWYFSLFPSIDAALERSDFAAEWGGGGGAAEHAWIGAGAPRMGVFVIDNGGMPFAAVGPVARAWELSAPTGTTPDEALARSRRESLAPWSTTWLIPQEAEPPLAVTALDADDDAMHLILLVRSRQDVGRVTIELLDPHGAPIGEVTHPVSDRPVRFVFPRHLTRAHRHHGHHESPRYIDNTRVQSVPQVIRIRTAGFWYERPTRFGEDLRFTLGGMRPIDDGGNELAGTAVDEE